MARYFVTAIRWRPLDAAVPIDISGISAPVRVNGECGDCPDAFPRKGVEAANFAEAFPASQAAAGPTRIVMIEFTQRLDAEQWFQNQGGDFDMIVGLPEGGC